MGPSQRQDAELVVLALQLVLAFSLEPVQGVLLTQPALNHQAQGQA